MKKGVFVEYVQHNLSAGLTVDDTQKKFPAQLVETAMELVIQDLVSPQNIGGSLRNVISPKTGKSIIQEDDLGRSYFTLPFEASSGIESLLFVAPTYNASPYTLHRNVAMVSVYRELQGRQQSNGVFLENGNYVFIKSPMVESVIVSMLPKFSEYEDEDDLVMGDKHQYVYQAILQMLTVNLQRVEDRINNQGPDAGQSN